MTTQDKIEVLERAISLIDANQMTGVCAAIAEAQDYDFLDDDGDWEDVCSEFLNACKIRLPRKRAHSSYCWPLTPEGDEQRRAFLRKHIERLRKELETEKA